MNCLFSALNDPALDSDPHLDSPIFFSFPVMLSDSESDNEDTHQFTINEHYAKAFHYRKEREELEQRTRFSAKCALP